MARQVLSSDSCSIGKGPGFSGRPCQDAAGVLVRADGVAVMAVSDGCSSSAWSEAAACMTVRAALSLWGGSADPMDLFGRGAARVVASSVTEAFSLTGGGRPDATLLVCVSDGSRFLTGIVGDGVFEARGVDGRVFSASRTFSGSAPPYPSYLVDNGSLSAWEDMGQEAREEAGGADVMESGPGGLWIAGTGDLAWALVASDGVFSVPGLAWGAPEWTRWKSPAGRFLTRRWSRVARESALAGGPAGDDLGGACVLFGEGDG